MSLPSGARLGPYEILAAIGAGGMGEVHRARDTRLDREVAIKVLPAAFARDEGRLRRFEVEARTLASLSHPNLLALYDIGTYDGSTYLVTELLHGHTLAARLHDGAMTEREVIETGRAIAAGLAAAHDKNVVHRDLKPANVFLTRDGHVKILDFGLARLAAPEQSPTGADESPTMSPVTAPGEILGTVGYMAPEQVRGQPADARTDIFALGATLYEMLTGRRAFQREDAAETLTAILRDDLPEPRATDPAISPALDRIVRRCLDKLPPRRFHSAHDLAFALEHAGARTTVALPPQTPRTSRFRRALLPLAMFAGGIALALASVWWLASFGAARGTSTDSSGASTKAFTPFSFEAGGQGHAVWSPDGEAVAYSASAALGEPPQVYVRHLDSPVPQKLTDIAEGAAPGAWTPDGRRIVFYSDRAPAGIWTVSSAGGAAQPLLAYAAVFKSWAASPGFKSLALLVTDAGGNNSIAISSPPGAAPQPYFSLGTAILQHDSTLAYSPDGKRLLLFIGRARTVLLIPIPADPAHPPRPVLAALVARGYSDAPTFSWLPDSRHIVLSINAPNSYASVGQLWVADVDSDEAYQVDSGTNARWHPMVSPDGRRLILAEPSGNADVVSVDLETASVHKLIATERNEDMPSWARHRQAIAYDTDRNGEVEIWMHETGRSDRPLVTLRDFPAGSTGVLVLPALSPNADRVAYLRLEPRADQPGVMNQRLWISSVAGGSPVPLTNTPSEWDSSTGKYLFGGEVIGSWSPDGNEMVFMQVKGPLLQLMKVQTSGQAEPMMLKSGVGPLAPVWSPTGEWIAYRDVDGDRLISPDGKTNRRLGEWTTPAWAFSADGRRLYGMRQAGAGTIGAQPGERQLFYVDIASGVEHVVGPIARDFAPNAYCPPCYRFSLSPDGKSLAYAVGNITENLWIMTGFEQPGGWRSRLSALFH